MKGKLNGVLTYIENPEKTATLYGIVVTENVDISGGYLKISGNVNFALRAGKNINISSKPGASTYVDITAYANVINGNKKLDAVSKKFITKL